MKKLIILIILTFTYSAMSQSLSVFDVDASNFPTIKAKFYAFDKDGNPLISINSSDFEVIEDGQPRTITFVSCPPPQPPIALSSVLVFDVSGSMEFGPPRIQSAKNAANAWIDGLLLEKSECALTAFNFISSIIQDFTTNINILKNAINKLTPEGGTDYNRALIDTPSGGIQIAKEGKYKKVIVFLTDGLPFFEPRVNDIIQLANENDITIFGVTLDMPAPQSIKDITLQTGGRFFENITTLKETEDYYKIILQSAHEITPCEIQWESEISCYSGVTNVEMKISNIAERITTSYIRQPSLIAKLEFNPMSVKFENPTPGVLVEQQVTVTARNADFSVTNIKNSNSDFEINPKSFVLHKNQSIELNLSYLAVDSGYVYSRFDFESEPCQLQLYARGGWRGIKPKFRTIKLLQPNGGEVFVAGSDTVITWEGISPDEPVKIEYRNDNNQPWITVKDSATGFSHPFRVPNIISSRYLARVTSTEEKITSCDNPEIEICGKMWMGCNLAVEHYRNGDPIRHVVSNEEWLEAGYKKEGAWCYYNNDPANGEIYGKLYNWYAVNDRRGLAPKGWHIPSDADWKALENCLGGTHIAGAKLKTTGKIEGGDGLWMSPNTGATNETDFSGLPAGSRQSTGHFRYINYQGFWWSASTRDENTAWNRYLENNNTILRQSGNHKFLGCSVRCIRD